MKNALIIFGGVSSEHDISLLSASSVIRNIPKDKYNVIMLGITKQGEMYLYDGDFKNLPEDKWLNDKALLKKAVISTDRNDRGIIVFNENGLEKIKIDVCFPVLHGKNGEDGTMQGLLTVAGIPFVGCGTMASAVCMDKAMTNSICDVNGIPQAKWKYITLHDFTLRGREFARECEEYLGLPVFIKPANAGSSVGVRKAKTVDEIYSALEYAFSFDDRVVVEEGIDGIEVECAVMGNDEPFAGAVGEIEPCNEFYDFNAKYIDNKSGLHIPARLSEEKREEIRTLAVKAYKAWGCTGLARVDFFVRHSDGKVLLNEPNTIPGFTSISMYPMLMEKAGISYGELIDKLCTFAIEKWEKEFSK
ncbi:MAG: D-alanine--D-alanine ligase family protein [Candidatus Fimenecus sp.]